METREEIIVESIKDARELIAELKSIKVYLDEVKNDIDKKVEYAESSIIHLIEMLPDEID